MQAVRIDQVLKAERMRIVSHQPRSARSPSHETPTAIVATVPHSWNQYDSGRMMRTTDPRSTISTA